MFIRSTRGDYWFSGRFERFRFGNDEEGPYVDGALIDPEPGRSTVRFAIEDWASAGQPVQYVPCAPGHFVVVSRSREEPPQLLAIIAWKINSKGTPWAVTFSPDAFGPARLANEWRADPVQFPDGHIEQNLHQYGSVAEYLEWLHRGGDELKKEASWDSCGGRAEDPPQPNLPHRPESPTNTGDGDQP